MRILLLEDDALIGDGIQAGLSELGNYAVDWFTDGVTGLEAARTVDYDAIILDLTLPGKDGIEILRVWRVQGLDTPVLILTARFAVEERVAGLNLGADDYMPKPFSLSELEARLRALIRRRHGKTQAMFEHGHITFNPQTRIFTVRGTAVDLSPRESALAEQLLLNGERVLSKAQLEEKLYPWGTEISSNAVEVHIHNIRKKLGATFVKTVHGVGYMLGGGS